MNLLQLKRMQVLQQQLYEFNYIKPKFYDASWSGFIDISMLDCMYQNLNDNFLKIIILPLPQFKKILYEAILILLLQDKTILISGKKLSFLSEFFNEKQIKSALNRVYMVRSTMLVDNTLLQIDDFYNQSALYLCSRIYHNTHVAMHSRLVLRFNRYLVINNAIKKFYDNFAIDILEKIVLAVTQDKIPTIFNMKFENQ